MKFAHLSSRDILQLEELLHQDLVDLHQDHIHTVSVDQRQVSVTLIPTNTNTSTLMSEQCQCE